MLKIEFNSNTNKFDIYDECLINNKLRKKLEESLTHSEINERITEFNNQIAIILNTVNELYLAMQKNPIKELSKI